MELLSAVLSLIMSVAIAFYLVQLIKIHKRIDSVEERVTAIEQGSDSDA